MTGLIQNVVDTTPKPLDINGATIGNASATGYDPSQVNIDQSKQTVSGQLKALLGQGSSYLDQARGNAMVQANSRGLINSSMAAGAGESAAINAALPIATSDANTYNTAALTNAASENTAAQFGAGSANAASAQNAGAVSDIGKQQLAGQQAVEQIGAQGTQQRATLAQSGTQDVALQTLKGTQSKDLANIEAQYKTLVQSSASAASLFQTTSAAMEQIMADPNTTTDQKTAAVNAMTQMLKSGMSVVGGVANIDLTGLLNFSAPAVA